MQPPHWLQASGSMTGWAPEESMASLSQDAAQTMQPSHVWPSTAGSVTPMSPRSFSWGLRQLLRHPETPNLSLCGSSRPAKWASMASQIALVSTTRGGRPRPPGSR
jgi:hypothetical protein